MHTRFGYYVFAVTRIYKRRPVTLKRQLETATQTLEQNAETAALNAFSHDFSAKWVGRTTCAAQYAFDAAD